jgi:type I restriction enzyme M protein
MNQAKSSDNTRMYINLLSGFMSPDSYLSAALLTDEVVRSAKDKSASSLYTTLLQCADKVGVKNPFPNEDVFYNFYRIVLDGGDVNWGELLQLTIESMKMINLPNALVKLMTEEFGNKRKTVLIAEAEKFAASLSQIIEEHPDSKFLLTTQNQSYQRVLEKICVGYKNVSVKFTNIYHYEFINERFDLILSNPIFGGRDLVDDDHFICRETDFVALENLSLHLNTGGLLEIVLPARISFAAGKAGDLRQFIQSNYSIRELSELPERIFSHTGIKTYLLKVENRRPSEDEDIDIKKYSAGNRRNRREQISSLNVEDDTFVMLSEIEEQGNWNVDQIFAKQDEDFIAFQNSTTRKELLKNVAEIFRGKAVKGKDLDGNIGVVNISNIKDFDIDYDSLDKISLDERKIATYILEEGDIILPARGTAVRTAVFRKQPYTCIASSNLIVIRPNSELLNSIYLKIFIDSPIGKKLVTGMQQGLSTMNISYKDLGNIEIPLPPIEKQQSIAKSYLEELTVYQETVRNAEKRWKESLKKFQQF